MSNAVVESVTRARLPQGCPLNSIFVEPLLKDLGKAREALHLRGNARYFFCDHLSRWTVRGSRVFLYKATQEPPAAVVRRPHTLTKEALAFRRSSHGWRRVAAVDPCILCSTVFFFFFLKTVIPHGCMKARACAPAVSGSCCARGASFDS